MAATTPLCEPTPGSDRDAPLCGDRQRLYQRPTAAAASAPAWRRAAARAPLVARAGRGARRAVAGRLLAGRGGEVARARDRLLDAVRYKVERLAQRSQRHQRLPGGGRGGRQGGEGVRGHAVRAQWAAGRGGLKLQARALPLPAHCTAAPWASVSERTPPAAAAAGSTAPPPTCAPTHLRPVARHNMLRRRRPLARRQQ
jgi:hypothetical protein